MSKKRPMQSNSVMEVAMTNKFSRNDSHFYKIRSFRETNKQTKTIGLPVLDNSL